MIKLDDALRGVIKLGFDTSPLIYFVEAYPAYDVLVVEVFRRVTSGALDAYTSVVSLSEVLVQPISKGNVALQHSYRDLLLYSRDFTTLDVDAGIAEQAATLRASYRLRTPDALQIAAAQSVGCDAFLTNDAALKRVTALRVLVLDELEL